MEFVAYKLAFNTATHIAIDIGGIAINRLKRFRPPTGVTLAI